MRSALLHFAAVVGVCCLFTGQAAAQIGWELEQKATLARDFTLKNTIARPVKYVRTSRLMSSPPLSPRRAALNGKKKSSSRNNASGAARDAGLLSDLRGTNDDLVFGSVGRSRTTLGEKVQLLSPSLMDTQSIIHSSRSHVLSFGATSKTSSAPRHRLSSP